MPHALLLSPDDQAVSAITAVLEEMSVTCERPLDGPSAAKKLTAQSFDLVLVDCENLPAAKLIFDVCRRSQTGTNPVPIAIVDGRAGLPTAFRLGAELILTKPVAKEQARTTIRTAVGRVRKDEPSRTSHPFEEPHAEAVTPAATEKLSHAAAAGATASPASSESPAILSTQPVTAKMGAATEEIATPAPKRQPSSMGDISKAPTVPPTDMFMPPAPAVAAKVSDDPVLADLESDIPTPVFTSFAPPPQKKRGPQVALLLLLLAGGGLYAAWMYQPGFREAAQPQINRLMSLVGGIGAPKQTAPPQPVPAPIPLTPSTPQPAPAIAPPTSDTTANSTTPATPTPSSPSTNTGAPVTAVAPLPDTSKTPVVAEAAKVPTIAAPSDAELPGEKTAVILSSQGAEKRLIRRVPPAYPADARKSGTEGTVVLKAVVDEAGAVQGVRLVEGNPTLAAAAISSVKQWRYRPYVRDGKAQTFQTIVLVEFQRP